MHACVHCPGVRLHCSRLYRALNAWLVVPSGSSKFSEADFCATGICEQKGSVHAVQVRVIVIFLLGGGDRALCVFLSQKNIAHASVCVRACVCVYVCVFHVYLNSVCVCVCTFHVMFVLPL